jgi:hypothetical protein
MMRFHTLANLKNRRREESDNQKIEKVKIRIEKKKGRKRREIFNIIIK